MPDCTIVQSCNPSHTTISLPAPTRGVHAHRCCSCKPVDDVLCSSFHRIFSQLFQSFILSVRLCTPPHRSTRLHLCRHQWRPPARCFAPSLSWVLTLGVVHRRDVCRCACKVQVVRTFWCWGLSCCCRRRHGVSRRYMPSSRDCDHIVRTLVRWVCKLHRDVFSPRLVRRR